MQAPERACSLAAVFAELPDPRSQVSGHDPRADWERMAFLEQLGVRALHVGRTIPRTPEPIDESSLALSLDLLPDGRRPLLAILPRHGFSEGASTIGPEVTAYVLAHCVQPGDGDGPWSRALPCAVRAERPALEIDRFAIALHYVSTPRSLLPAAAADSARRGFLWRSPKPPAQTAPPPSNESAGVFDSFERDILAYAYRDSRPFRSSTDVSQPPGGYPVIVRLPEEIELASEGQPTRLWSGAASGASGRDLPLRALRNRTVFPGSGVQIFHLTLTPDPDQPGFVFSEYDLIKIAKLCEGGEEFQGGRIEFHTVWPDPATGVGGAPAPALDWRACSSSSHPQPCRFLDFHDFFHLTQRGSFGDFPHGCADWRYCEPRAATIQVTTAGTPHAGGWDDVYTHLNMLAGDRARALDHLHRHLSGQAATGFPTGADRLMAFGGILGSLLDFERIDWWELGDVLKPIDNAEGFLLYLHKGVLLNLAESDRAAAVEQSRAYVGINPYLLAAHTVLLHNEQVLRLAREEVDNLPPDLHVDRLQRRDLAQLRRAYRALDGGLYSDCLPNVFHYPTEQTIYGQGHQELGLDVEREALERRFEHVGRTIEAAKATDLGTAQLNIAIVALFVSVFSIWQVVMPLWDYTEQAVIMLVSGGSSEREGGQVAPVSGPSPSVSTSAPEPVATGPASVGGPATPAVASRDESQQQTRLFPLLMYTAMSIGCTLWIWRLLRQR
jgi:hypothetical protein